MKKQLGYLIFLASIGLICLVGSVGMLLPQGGAETGGNEVLTAAPSLRDRTGNWNPDYLSQLSDYLESHYYHRQERITAWSELNTFFLNTSIAGNVLLGQDNWLYFGDTLNDYLGLDPLGEREIFSAAHNLSLISEYCRQQGAAFLFTIAPNKNSIYPEHMPSLTKFSEQKNAVALAKELETEGVAYLDLFALFSQQPETLYFTQDSHWNSKGAALAADGILEALSRASPTPYFDGPFVPAQSHLSDLYSMLYPTGAERETDPEYGRAFQFTYDAPIRSAENLTIMTTGNQRGSLLMFRDSFGNLLYPYLADAFGKALFSRSTAYRLDLLGPREADCVVIELVERNLDYLIQPQNVPLMPAPSVGQPEGAQLDSEPIVPETEESEDLPGYTLLRGNLPWTAEERSPVLLSCGDGCFEAFLLENDGFALYLPTESLGTDGNWWVHVQKDGTWIKIPVSVNG